MFSRSILKMLLFATILLAAVASATAAAPPNEEAQSSVWLDSHLPDAGPLAEEHFRRACTAVGSGVPQNL